MMKIASMLLPSSSKVKVVRRKQKMVIIANGQHINLNLNNNYVMRVIGSYISFKTDSTKTILKIKMDDAKAAEAAANYINKKLTQSQVYQLSGKAVVATLAVGLIYVFVTSLISTINADPVPLAQSQSWVDNIEDIDRTYPEIVKPNTDENSLDALLSPKPPVLAPSVTTAPEKQATPEHVATGNSLDNLLGAVSPVQSAELQPPIEGISQESMSKLISDPVAKEVFEKAMLMRDEHLKSQPAAPSTFGADLSPFGLSSGAPSCEPSLAFN